jgi:hypothetical protein
VESVANYACDVKKKVAHLPFLEFNCSRTVARAEKPSFQLKFHPHYSVHTQDSPGFISGEEKIDNAALTHGFIPPSLR